MLYFTNAAIIRQLLEWLQRKERHENNKRKEDGVTGWKYEEKYILLSSTSPYQLISKYVL